jgi:hypothetical protein
VTAGRLLTIFTSGAGCNTKVKHITFFRNYDNFFSGKYRIKFSHKLRVQHCVRMTLNTPEIPMFAGRITVVYHMTHPWREREGFIVPDTSCSAAHVS